MADLLDQFGQMIKPEKRFSSLARRGGISARWDAVQTTDENQRHWANADGLSAKSAASPQVRRTFRNRSRYEYQNNSYCQGIVLSLANHIVGRGPRLQMLTGDKETDRAIENKFWRWMRRVKLAPKLRTAVMSEAVDGESFLLKTTNLRPFEPITLDIALIEADQIATPNYNLNPSGWVDGIEFDSYGNPQFYHKLKTHPGESMAMGLPSDYDKIPAADVIHLFREDRPGQLRGIPQIAPALPLFAMLRRFTLATIAAAETAADFAAVMYTDAASTDEAEQLAEDQWFDAIPIEYRAMLTLPNGWKMGQLKAEHPTTTYDMFKRAILQEITRCLNMPYNIAAGDSSSYNYSSGRLDHQTYFRAIEIAQSDLEDQVMDRLFSAWLEEAALIPDYLPDFGGTIDELAHQWFWDAVADIDPVKTANAAEIAIRSGIGSRVRAYAQQGLDIDDEDQKAADCYGIPLEEYRQGLWKSTFFGGMNSQGQQPQDQGAGDGESQNQDSAN